MRSLNTILLLLFLAACSKQKEPEKYTILSSEPASPPPASTPQGLEAPRPAAPAGELTWTDPSAWTKRPPTSPMRKAEYTIPKAGTDAENAECTVFTFGAGQGGGVDQNLDRWIKQFDPAE